MQAETNLEQLLRASDLTNGSISLTRVDGSRWRAVIAHNRHGDNHPFSHMVHPFDQWHDDPVDALRVALVEDERQCRDVRRRYNQAAKFGDLAKFEQMDNQAGVDSDFDAADTDDLLG